MAMLSLGALGNSVRSQHRAQGLCCTGACLNERCLSYCTWPSWFSLTYYFSVTQCCNVQVLPPLPSLDDFQDCWQQLMLLCNKPSLFYIVILHTSFALRNFVSGTNTGLFLLLRQGLLCRLFDNDAEYSPSLGGSNTFAF